MIGEHQKPQLFFILGGAMLAATGLLAQPMQPTTPVQAQADPADTRSTPRVLADINPSDSSDATGFSRIGRFVYFRANDGSHGSELWRTDGTSEGTTLIADINPGEGSSAPEGMKSFARRIYFAASSADTGREVWATDGTAEGTSLVRDINPGTADALPAVFVRFADALYFRAQDAATGLELWKTQGTADTTVLVADLHPGTEGSIPTYPTVFRKALYFSADDSFTPGIGFDRELWRTDGTANGTSRVKDINPGAPPSIPGEIMRFGQMLIFKAGDAVQGGELWKSDGTEAGTTIIGDMNPGPASSFPTNLTRVRRHIYFAANDGETGRELWRTDGTAEGTTRVMDINPGPANASPIGVPFRGGYLFAADDAAHGRELWFSDGTPAGTRLVKDVNPGPALSGPLDLTVVGRHAWFATVVQNDTGDGTVRSELWRTDGTEAGTRLVWQAPGWFNGYTIRGLMATGRALLFTAPTRADANGMASDFEPHVLSPIDRASGEMSESNEETSAFDEFDDESSEDRALESPATVDEIGLPLSRSTNRQTGGR